MADFTITVNGKPYDHRDAAIAVVRSAWDAWKAANRDARLDGDRADYLEFKAENRPADDEFDGASAEEKALYAEIQAANLEAALAAREPIAAE